MLARPRRHPKDSADRAFRALARGELARVVDLVNAAAPGLLPLGRRITPAHVDDPHLDANPRPLDGDSLIRVGRRDLLHTELQGYREVRFPDRLFRYHLGYVDRYPGFHVHSVAIWTLPPPQRQRRDQIVRGDVIVRITTVVLPELPASLLIGRRGLACFAVGAEPGEWSVEELCSRVVEVMRRDGASRDQWRVAGVVAATQGRYKEFMRAMEMERGKPVIVDELVLYGQDLGYRRGRRQGLKQGREQGREQGMRRALLATYEARFGVVPSALAAAVEAIRDADALLEWQAVFSTRSAREIAAALRASSRR